MALSFIEILKVVFLGIVEGVTEWLPISSTGHMLLVDEFISLNASTDFKEMFFVVIQLGAILAVVTIFWNKIYIYFQHVDEFGCCSYHSICEFSRIIYLLLSLSS